MGKRKGQNDLHPMEAFRRKERAKEKLRKKQQQKPAAGAGAAASGSRAKPPNKMTPADARALKDQLVDLTQIEINRGKLTPEQTSLRSKIKRDLDDYNLHQADRAAAAAAVDEASVAPRKFVPPKDPTRSVYYHPTWNPLGAPPPGMEYREIDDTVDDDSTKDTTHSAPSTQISFQAAPVISTQAAAVIPHSSVSPAVPDTTTAAASPASAIKPPLNDPLADYPGICAAPTNFTEAYPTHLNLSRLALPGATAPQDVSDQNIFDMLPLPEVRHDSAAPEMYVPKPSFKRIVLANVPGLPDLPAPPPGIGTGFLVRRQQD
ncbi:MAG: hypothetical protein SGCHY_004275 [Lobulomycetales sp.]